MNKLKYLVAIFCIVLACGCEAKYNLKINSSGEFEEETIVSYSDVLNFDNNVLLNNTISPRLFLNSKLESKIYAYYDSMGNPYDLIEDEENYYKQINISDDKKLGIKYNYSFSKNNFERSSIVNSCYDNFNILNDNGVNVISTSLNFKCFELYPELDSVVVSIKVDKNFKVVENNADKVNGNTYTWNIYEYNSKDKAITLKYKDAVKKTNATLSILIGVSVIVLIGLIIFIFINNSSKKNNKI